MMQVCSVCHHLVNLNLIWTCKEFNQNAKYDTEFWQTSSRFNPNTVDLFSVLKLHISRVIENWSDCLGKPQISQFLRYIYNPSSRKHIFFYYSFNVRYQLTMFWVMLNWVVLTTCSYFSTQFLWWEIQIFYYTHLKTNRKENSYSPSFYLSMIWTLGNAMYV